MARVKKAKSFEGSSNDANDPTSSAPSAPPSPPKSPSRNKKWRGIRFGRRNGPAGAKVSDEDPMSSLTPMPGPEDDDVDSSTDMETSGELEETSESGQGSAVVDNDNGENNELPSGGSDLVDPQTDARENEGDAEPDAQTDITNKSAHDDAADTQTNKEGWQWSESDDNIGGNDGDSQSTPQNQQDEAYLTNTSEGARAPGDRPQNRWSAARRATARFTTNIIKTTMDVDRLADTGKQESILETVMDGIVEQQIQAGQGVEGPTAPTSQQQQPQTAGMKTIVQLQNQLRASEKKNASLQSELTSVKAAKEEAEVYHKATVEKVKLESEETAMKLSVLEQYFFELNNDEETKRNIGVEAATVAENNGSMVTLDAAYVAELKADVERFRDESAEYKEQVEEHRKTSQQIEADLEEQVEDLTQKLECREDTIKSLEASLAQMREARFKHGTTSASDEDIATAVASALEKEREKHKRGVDSLKEKVRKKLRSKDSTIARLVEKNSDLEKDVKRSRSHSPVRAQFDLGTVKATNEMMDASITRLEAMLKNIYDHNFAMLPKQGEEAEILSVTEKINLVQIELQTSVKLLEQRMTNQLENQRDEVEMMKDNSPASPAAENETEQPSGEDLETQEGDAKVEEEKVEQSQQTAQIESLEKRIQEVQDDTTREIRKIETTIRQKVVEMKDKAHDLEIELETRRDLVDSLEQARTEANRSIRKLTEELDKSTHSKPVADNGSIKNETSDTPNRSNQNLNIISPETKGDIVEKSDFFSDSGAFSVNGDELDVQDDVSTISNWTNFEENSVFTSKSENKTAVKTDESAWKVDNDVPFPSTEDDKESFPATEKSNEISTPAPMIADSNKSSSGGNIPALPKMKRVTRNPLRARAAFLKSAKSQSAYSTMVNDSISEF